MNDICTAKLIHFFQLLVALVSASVLAEPEAEAQSTVDFEIAGGYGYEIFSNIFCRIFRVFLNSSGKV